MIPLVLDTGVVVKVVAAASLDVDLVTSGEGLHRKVSGRLPWLRLFRDFGCA